MTSDEHHHYRQAQQWFGTLKRDDLWALCPLTEAGYLRLAMNPAVGFGPGNLTDAINVLKGMASRPGYCYWPLTETWVALTAPLAGRIFGHQQVTDACLLGLAIKNDGTLVSFDRGLRFLAGPEFARHLLILE